LHIYPPNKSSLINYVYNLFTVSSFNEKDEIFCVLHEKNIEFASKMKKFSLSKQTIPSPAADSIDKTRDSVHSLMRGSK